MGTHDPGARGRTPGPAELSAVLSAPGAELSAVLGAGLSAVLAAAGGGCRVALGTSGCWGGFGGAGGQEEEEEGGPVGLSRAAGAAVCVGTARVEGTGSTGACWALGVVGVLGKQMWRLEGLPGSLLSLGVLIKDGEDERGCSLGDG